MAYSNAQILAAVVSHWARPAITQIATSRLSQLPLVQSLQNMAISYGIVNSTYNIGGDLKMLVAPAINNVLQPYLERQFTRLPDESIPGLARDVLEEAKKNGNYTLMDGFITLDAEDIAELGELIEKNLPPSTTEGYVVKT